MRLAADRAAHTVDAAAHLLEHAIADFTDNIAIVAGAAEHPVGSLAAVEVIVAVKAFQQIVAQRPEEYVGGFVADEGPAQTVAEEIIRDRLAVAVERVASDPETDLARVGGRVADPRVDNREVVGRQLDLEIVEIRVRPGDSQDGDSVGEGFVEVDPAERVFDRIQILDASRDYPPRKAEDAILAGMRGNPVDLGLGDVAERNEPVLPDDDLRDRVRPAKIHCEGILIGIRIGRQIDQDEVRRREIPDPVGRPLFARRFELIAAAGQYPARPGHSRLP